MTEHDERMAWLAIGAALVLAWLLVWPRLVPEGPARHARSTSSVRRRVRASSVRVRTLLVGRWRRLVPGSFGYIAAQVALLYVSLRAVGLDAPVTIVVMAAAIERLGTLVPVTPAGKQSRLGVIGGDNQGWPNGRRLNDDVVDIAEQAVGGFLVGHKLPLGDGVNSDDAGTMDQFPYVADPLSGAADSHGAQK